jgi:putative ABC transport system permease protein
MPTLSLLLTSNMSGTILLLTINMYRLREWLTRVTGGFGARRSDDELGGELRFHLEMLEERHRALGLDPAAARRAARLELGGDAQIAEAWRDQRGLPFVDTLRQDVRYGLRMLRRAPGFTLAALMTLALGIGANTAIFTVVDAVLFRPLPYAAPERLVTVGDRNPQGFSSEVAWATVFDWQRRSRSFDSLAMLRFWQPTLVTNGEGERLGGLRVSWNYFDMLGVRPALGRGFTADDDRRETSPVVLLSDGLWRRRFGADPAMLGRTVLLNGRDYRVVGVMPGSFEPLDAERYYNATAEVWTSLGYDLASTPCRSCTHLRAFGRLARGVTLAAATAEMNAIREEIRREYPREYEAGTIAVVPLAHALTGNVQAALYVLLGAAGFVLLIACANVANLLLARSVSRQRELALRAVLGAGRGRIVRQLLTESLMLSAGGAVAGVLLAWFVVQGLDALAPVSLPRLDHVAIDGRVLGFTALVAVLTGLFFGLLPAWHGGTAAGAQALALDSRGSVGRGSRTRAVLVVADLVLALVLLAGAGLMLRTVAVLTRASPGFDASRFLTLRFSLTGNAYMGETGDRAVLAFQDRLLEHLRAVPGVAGAALAGQIPFGGVDDCWAFHARDRMKPNPADDPCVERYGISRDYLRVMDIPILAGRAFDDTDSATSAPVILISQATARAVWGSSNPIGAQVRIGSSTRWRTVVGVVADVHHDDLTTPPRPAMYNPQAQITGGYFAVVVKSAGNDAAALAGPVRAVLRQLDPSIPVYQIATLSTLVAKSAAQRLFVTRLLGGFAIVALLLAAIGLYGVVSHGVAQRTRELGVRIALGAQRHDVLRAVLSSGLLLVGIGVAGGLAAAVAATRFLGALVFGVSPMDPATFAGAAALLIVVALAAHWVPARRALRIDPATTLRAE